jgi:hypothetical protein
LIGSGMIAEVPPLSYTGRAKNLFFNILSQYLMDRAFFQPVEEVIRSIVGHDFAVEVSKGQGTILFILF